MQLFSIGLHKLNIDGTLQLDSEGNPILTYTNNDIAEYAKIYTGLSRRKLRSNVEDQRDPFGWRNNQSEFIKELFNWIPDLCNLKKFLLTIKYS